MAKSLLENACLDGGLFAFGESTVRIYDVGLIRVEGHDFVEPPREKAFFVGSRRAATRFACAAAAELLFEDAAEAQYEGDTVTATRKEQFARRYRDAA